MWKLNLLLHIWISTIYKGLKNQVQSHGSAADTYTLLITLTLSLARSANGMRFTCPLLVSLDRQTPSTTANTRTPRRHSSSTRARGIRTRSQPGKEPLPLLCCRGLYRRLDLDMTAGAGLSDDQQQLRVQTDVCGEQERNTHRKEVEEADWKRPAEFRLGCNI